MRTGLTFEVELGCLFPFIDLYLKKIQLFSHRPSYLVIEDMASCFADKSFFYLDEFWVGAKPVDCSLKESGPRGYGCPYSDLKKKK